MTTYILGSLTKSLFEPNFIPIGIVVRENETVEVRVVSPDQIPERYKPTDQLSQLILTNIEPIFHDTLESSSHPTNLYFTIVTLEEETGSLAERADRLFQQYVQPRYQS